MMTCPWEHGILKQHGGLPVRHQRRGGGALCEGWVVSWQDSPRISVAVPGRMTEEHGGHQTTATTRRSHYSGIRPIPRRMERRDMSSHSLVTELLKTIGPSIDAVVPFGRTFLGEAIRLGLYAGGGVGVSLLTLLLTFLLSGNPPPTPAPPLPF
jgi:hypothetical protein